MTIREIATQLNVSPASVSIVLNSKPGVGTELRKRITDALIKNGYSIKENKTAAPSENPVPEKAKTILFLYYIEERYLLLKNNDVLSIYLNEIQGICNQHNCNLLVRNVTDESFCKELMNTDGIDGIILLGIEMLEQSALDRSISNKPLVILDGHFPFSSVDSVNIDNQVGLYNVVKYLYQNGHRKIGHIKSKTGYGCLPDRWRSFYQALHHFGLACAPEHVLEVSMPPSKLQEDVIQYLKNTKDLPTAFFADNDFIATSAMIGIQQAGYTIPDDFSIIGFDNVDISTLFKPNLTTVTMDFRGMAQAAVLRLLRLIQEPDATIIKSTITPSFIERESVKDLGNC